MAFPPPPPTPPPPPLASGTGSSTGAEGEEGRMIGDGNYSSRNPQGRGRYGEPPDLGHGVALGSFSFAAGLLLGGGGGGSLSRCGRGRGRPARPRRPLPYLSTLAANPRLLGGGQRSNTRTAGGGDLSGDDDDDDCAAGDFVVPLLEEARRLVAEEEEEAKESRGSAAEASELYGSGRLETARGGGGDGGGAGGDERVTAEAIDGGTEAGRSGEEDGDSNLDTHAAASLDGEGGTSARDGPCCPLDDPANSSLTRGQHERYLALRDMHVAGHLSLSSKSTPTTQRKRRRMWRDEFRTLRDLVGEERTRYAEALADWRGRNADRFLVGFKVDIGGPASKFVNAASRRVDGWRRRWKASGEDTAPTRYGRCTQSISLPMPLCGGAGGGRGGVTSHVVALGGDEGDHEDDDVVIPDDADRRNDDERDRELAQRGVDLNDWASTVVSTGEDASKGGNDGAPRGGLPVIDGEIATSLRNVPLAALGDGVDDDHRDTSRERMAEESLLAEDGEALALATRHGAAVLLPVEAFAALLQKPGGRMSRWKIPLSKVSVDESGVRIPRSGRGGKLGSSSRSGNAGPKEIVVMEHPVPQPSTPRECLTHGFDGPLYLALSRSKSKSGQYCSYEQVHTQYAYSLLSIPSSSSSSGGGPLKVMVRLANDLQDEDGCPIRRLVQLEYFPERGWERYTPHSRCLWVLEKLLQPTARVLVGRVDAARAVLLRVEERGVAHALSDRTCDPTQFFAAAAVVMRAVTKLRAGSHILCLPGCVGGGVTSPQTTTLSVHEAIGGDGGDAEATIDIGRELTNAESVFTNRAALLACFRMWEWDEDAQAGRVPYTFPLKKESEETEHKKCSKRQRT